MKTVNMDTAIRRYNGIMISIAREHNTIGTSLSECTEKWNLRDMVSEMQYTLDLWQDETSLAWAGAHDETQPVYNGKKAWLYNWRKEIARMKRFISTYSKFVNDLECAAGHCSIYD